MKQQEKNIAVCGLPCYKCDILLSSDDLEKAKKEAAELKQMLGMDVKPKEVRCDGCKGDRSRHFSPDCWILHCCVDEKGLEFCYECTDFPCEKLNEMKNMDRSGLSSRSGIRTKNGI
jgi:hypothetical protein